MANIVTVLTRTVSHIANTITLMTPTHTAAVPKLVTHKSLGKGASGVMLDDKIRVSHASVDTDGADLGTVDFQEYHYRRNADSDPAIATYLQTLFEEIIASDNINRVNSRQQAIDDAA
jgi:hypothetical protein